MTKREAKEKRVEDLANAAVEEFLEKGYENASMESIAKRAGVSKGGLYHYFGSKDELLVAANEKLTEPIYGMMKAAAENADAREGIEKYIESYLAHWTEHQTELLFFFLTMTKALSCRDLWGMYEEYSKGMLKFFEDIYNKGIEDGVFVQHDVKASAVTLMSALDGVTAYLIMSSRFKLEDVVGSFKEKFVNSLLVRCNN